MHCCKTCDAYYLAEKGSCVVPCPSDICDSEKFMVGSSDSPGYTGYCASTTCDNTTDTATCCIERDYCPDKNIICFTADPWIVGQASYSAQTRVRLLEGLHLGEFGRCEPIDPFTRKRLTPASGTFLHDMPKRARKVCTICNKNLHWS